MVARLKQAAVQRQEPPLGSHLITPRRGYLHHGFHVGSGNVVHHAGLVGGSLPAMEAADSAAGALSAPVAGRLADRGLTRPATGWALVAAVFAFAVAAEARLAHSLALLIIAALILDAAVQMCQVLSLRSLYMLAPELRGGLNDLFIAFAFLCGAAGSGLAAAVYTSRGWTTLAALGALCVGTALAQFVSELWHWRARPAFLTANRSRD
jgi:MFS family permease